MERIKKGQKTNAYWNIGRAVDRGEISLKDLKSTYSKLRKQALAQINTVKGSELPYAADEITRFRTLRQLTTESDLLHEVADIVNFINSPRYTMRGRRDIRDRTIATLAERGIYVDKSEWMEWVNFITWFKHSEYAALYDSDSAAVAAVFEQGANSSDWERAFEEWRLNHGPATNS